MRINKGAKVEAWTQDAASPMGAWRGGEVHWGNGHSYILRWFDGGPDSGRIPRKSVRPCPPPVALPADLAAGDMVEVFDNSLWKCAEFVRASGDGQFDVKIVGSTRVVTAGLDMLRVRQVLRDDNSWVALHKGNEIHGATALPSRAIPGKQGKGAGHGGGKFAATPALAKRSRCMMDAERFAGDTKRLRAKEEAARYDDNLEVIDVNPAIFLDKQQEMGSEECNVVGTYSNSDDDDDTKSVSSSSASSSASGSSSSSSNNSGDRAVSATSNPCEDHQHANQLQRNCKEEHSDDRTASRVSARRRPGDEGAVAVYQEGKVHHLELDAYTALTRAFHATGSLTWTKEELLSNLRLHLNISSDEHLQVIWELSGRRRPGRPGRP